MTPSGAIKMANNGAPIDMNGLSLSRDLSSQDWGVIITWQKHMPAPNPAKIPHVHWKSGNHDMGTNCKNNNDRYPASSSVVPTIIHDFGDRRL